MELAVEDAPNVPEDHLVSVRVGDVRRQAPLAKLRRQPLKFPCDPDSVLEPLRIDVYQPMAAARVVLHPQDQRYSVQLAGKNTSANAPMELGFRICGRKNGAVNKGSTTAAMGDSLPVQPESTAGKDSGKMQSSTMGLLLQKEDPDQVDEMAQTVRHYLDSKGVMRYVQALLHAVIQERPEDPYDYMRRQMQLVCEQRNDKAGEPEKTATKELKQTNHQQRNDKAGEHQQLEDARKQLQKDLQSARENGGLEKALNGLTEQQVASNQSPRDVQVARELREGFEKADRVGKLEEKCSDLLRPPSNDSTQEQTKNRMSDVQVARELREGFGKAGQVGQLEEKCRDLLRPPSNDSTQEQTKNRMKDALVSDKFESALGNRHTKQPVALEHASQPDSRPPRPPGPTAGQQPMKETPAVTAPQPSVPKETVPKKLVVEQPTAGQRPKETPAWTVPQPSGPTQPEMKKQPQVVPDGEQPQVEDDAFEEARRICKRKMYESFKTGQLAEVLRRVLSAPPAPPPPQRAEVQTPYPDTPHTGPPPLGWPTPPEGPLPVQPPTPHGAPPTLPSAPVGTLLPEAVEQARIRLQNLLQSALQSGTLDTVVNTLKASEDGGHEPALDLDNIKALQAKERIRQVLEQGLVDGTLDRGLGSLCGAGGVQHAQTAKSEQRVASDQASRDVQVARELREGFEKACRDGQMEEKCTVFLRPPSNDSTQEQSAAAAAAPARTGTAATTAASSLENLQPKVGPVGEQPQAEDDAFEEARRICNGRLYEAVENGSLAEVLRRVLQGPSPENQISHEDALPAPPHPNLQTPYPDTPHSLIVGDSTGPSPLGRPTPGGLLAMQPPTPSGAPPTLPSSPVGTLLPEAVEQAPIRIQHVLQSALQSGTLDTVVNTLLAKESASSDVQVARELREGFEKACQDGQLEEKCSDVLRPPSNDSTQEQTKNRMSDVQVARELRDGFGKAGQVGQLEEKCRDMLRPPSNDSMQEQVKHRMRDALASDKFWSALENLQAKQPSAVEQSSQPDARPHRPPGPTKPRPTARRSHTQDIVSVREQLKDLKTENERLREKVDQLEKSMQEEEEKSREATLVPPAA